LRAHLGARDVTHAEPPQQLADGTDTHVYGFQLQGADAGSDWLAPLVLRIFRSDDAAS
jgi:hypothetical protein